jgi:RHS repeat-associated protein
MQGISSKAAGKSENRLRFNDGTELESKEFSEGSGIELYSTTFRSYDPQIGRFHQVDPLAELTFGVGTYVFGLNNPISFNDPLGLTSDTITLPEIVINGGPAPPPKCFHCGISPVVNPESQNNNPPETSDDSDPNRSTFGDIAYEINRFNPLANLINGLHTWAFGYDTYGVPQDRYQGTAQIISAIPLGRIASATTNLVQGATSRVVITTITQLQKKFNHAQAFGVSGNWSVENGLKFLSEINQHLNHSATTVIAGTYRNSSKNVLFYLNPFDGKLVITSLDGEFITAYKATQDQVQSIVERQFLW